MHERYQKDINDYTAVINILEHVTTDKSMPSRWW